MAGEALGALEVRYLLVGMGVALIEGAPGTTQDLDLWFGSIDGEKVGEAARRAGGFYTSGFGLQPPAIGGDGLDRVDIVLNVDGLGPFEEEYARSLEGLRVRVLPLERVAAQSDGDVRRGLGALTLCRFQNAAGTHSTGI